MDKKTAKQLKDEFIQEVNDKFKNYENTDVKFFVLSDVWSSNDERGAMLTSNATVADVVPALLETLAHLLQYDETIIEGVLNQFLQDIKKLKKQNDDTSANTETLSEEGKSTGSVQ